MATTAKGTPYVESSDLVADYPSVSLALAEHIDDFGGKVLQVVYGSTSTVVSTTSSTFSDTGLTATITPSASTSEILILVSQSVSLTSSNQGTMSIRMLRNSTTLQNFLFVNHLNVATSVSNGQYNSHFFIDDPATTSATTYKTQFAMPTAASTTGYVQRSSATSSILLVELGA